MRNLILGTAGHIDHGKTELVRALTGVDTDRLKEEKERGITIDLGFAELPGVDLRLGVVDVPGHEGFVRNMLAGATGMDVVVMVVAADEGVMPQTREHLAIVGLLGVQRLVVALTKVDLVEPDWLGLVRDEVREVLGPTPYRDAPVVETSSRTGEGIDALRNLLLDVGSQADSGDPDDLTFLPVDRAFSVRGTGTVVTGTLWSGRLRAGARVRLLPDGHEGRVRGLQVHGSEVDEAVAGSRVAVALAGDAVGLDTIARGQALVTEASWSPSHMLTVRFRLLADTGWELAHNQRVRVHLGTAEVMARCVVFGDGPLRGGEQGWGQLRLEAPAAARTRQRAVIRSYSPVVTIGGAEVVEPHPPKRKSADEGLLEGFAQTLEGGPREAVSAVAERAGRGGVPMSLLSVHTGLTPSACVAAVEALGAEGAVRTPSGRFVVASVARDARSELLERVDRLHEAEPFRAGLPVEALREAVGEDAAEGLADALIADLVDGGALVVDRGIVARKGFQPVLTEAQRDLKDRLAGLYRDAGLEPPTLNDLPADARENPAFWVLLRQLEDEGLVISIDEGSFVWREALDAAAAAVRRHLGGRDGLGPADFKEAVPVSRRYLLPLLAHFDRTGVTVRRAEGRDVPRSP